MMAEINNNRLSGIIIWHFLWLHSKGNFEINVTYLWVLKTKIPALTTYFRMNVKILLKIIFQFKFRKLSF